MSRSEERDGANLLVGGVLSDATADQFDLATEGAGFTVNEAVDSGGFGRFQWLLLIYVGMAWMSDALEMMLLSYLGPALRCEWGLTPIDEAAVTTVVFVGMLVGANVWGWLADLKGRRAGFLYPGLFSCVAGVASAAAPNFTSLLLCRALVGLGLGGVPVAFNMFLEFLPLAGRGQYLVLFETFWAVGAVVEAGLAWAVFEPLGWRWLVGLSAVPLILLMLLFPLLPESPHYLVINGRVAEAEAILRRIARINKTILPPGRLLPADHAPATEAEGGKVANILEQMFGPTMLRTTLLLWLVFFNIACIYYGVVLLATQIHVSESTCNDEGHAQFSDAAFGQVLVTTCAELPGLAIAALVVERFGRLASIKYSVLLCAVAMLGLVAQPSMQASTALLFLARATVMVAFTVLYIYAPEVFPTSIRGSGVGTANAMARVGGMLAPFLSIELVEDGSLAAAAAVFSLLGMLTVWAVHLLPIETKGRALQEAVVEVEMADLSLALPDGGRFTLEEDPDTTSPGARSGKRQREVAAAAAAAAADAAVALENDDVQLTVPDSPQRAEEAAAATGEAEGVIGSALASLVAKATSQTGANAAGDGDSTTESDRE